MKFSRAQCSYKIKMSIQQSRFHLISWYFFFSVLLLRMSLVTLAGTGQSLVVGSPVKRRTEKSYWRFSQRSYVTFSTPPKEYSWEMKAIVAEKDERKMSVLEWL
ncbi:Hypothetical_protein [Hexamita inflata]|uniref:Hypothetical_protein n=1 Tax=Hexamita inflata TaxID=28002 RepID=A0AA86UHR4_9EUKA|nr:Hypothetical protein HINF_LOCUS28248 [Hexamita inflata]